MKQITRKPTAKVSINKSLLKSYRVDGEDCYFLKNGMEFELELFNPLQETILCKITFNGNKRSDKISDNGLVLKPGERVFLERYLETNNRFKFETYEVEDSEESKFAIQKNGTVRITFHKELQHYPYYGNLLTISDPHIYYYNGGTITTTGTTTGTVISNLTNSSCTSWAGDNTTLTASFDCAAIETGTIEKGSSSSQSFTYVNKDFDAASFNHVEFKLLPDTYKPKTSEDLKVRTYCTQCGKKARVKDKFCSVCGNKLK